MECSGLERDGQVLDDCVEQLVEVSCSVPPVRNLKADSGLQRSALGISKLSIAVID